MDEAGRPVSSRCAEVLDREIRRLCSELSERDLALGIVAERATKAEVWRRLGFATEAQYARERVGVSVSSLKAKRILAARTERVPELATAVSSGRVGYEAAYLLSRVVTPATVGQWLGRAEKRTVKHLREEVEAVEVLVRMGLGRDQPPPDEQFLEELFELERCIVSGEWVGRTRDSWAGEGTKGNARDGSQMSGVASGKQGTAAGQMSGARRAVRLRCSSPVCTRRDLTPHHLVFRSRGGGDEDENVTSLCVWCHLHGVHEGRIAAEPPASRIRWRIGRSGTLRVEGRTTLH